MFKKIGLKTGIAWLAIVVLSLDLLANIYGGMNGNLSIGIGMFVRCAIDCVIVYFCFRYVKIPTPKSD